MYIGPAVSPGQLGLQMTQQNVRTEIASRLIAASERWQRIGNLSLLRHDSGGHDSIRMSRQIMAAVGIIRSKRYAVQIDDQFLVKIRGKSATEIATMIADRFPRGKLPGYVER